MQLHRLETPFSYCLIESVSLVLPLAQAVYLDEIGVKLNGEDPVERPLRRAIGFMDLLNKVKCILKNSFFFSHFLKKIVVFVASGSYPNFDKQQGPTERLSCHY